VHHLRSGLPCSAARDLRVEWNGVRGFGFGVCSRGGWRRLDLRDETLGLGRPFDRGV
jgi:hypothetical protein